MQNEQKKPLLLNKEKKKKKARKPNRKIGKELEHSKNRVYKLPKVSLASLVIREMQALTKMRYTNTYIHTPDIYQKFI